MFAILIEQKLLTVIIFSLLLLSIICQIIIGVIYQNMIHEVDNMSTTKNKQLKQCKLKFANCYQLNGGIANIPVFVDKFISRLNFLHISLNSFSLLSGQLVMLSVLTSGIGICMAIVAGETLLRILPYYLVSILSLYLYFSVSGFVDSRHRKDVLKINLMDYLENHMLARLKSQTPEDIQKHNIAVKNKRPAMMDEHNDTIHAMVTPVQQDSANIYAEEELENLLKELLV